MNSELFESGKTYFPVAYLPNTGACPRPPASCAPALTRGAVTFEKIDMTLLSSSNKPLFKFNAEPAADSSSATSRRLLKGSFGGGGGGTSSGRGASSGRARGTSSYSTGTGTTRNVNYRSCVPRCVRGQGGGYRVSAVRHSRPIPI